MMLEIGTFTDYIIGNKCEGLNAWADAFEAFGLIDRHGDKSCFDVNPVL
jgi:hypothetical protein